MHTEISAAVVLGVTLTALAAIIGIVSLVFGISKSTFNDGATELTTTLDSVNETQLKADYDNKIVTGEMIIESMDKYVNRGDEITLLLATTRFLNEYELGKVDETKIQVINNYNSDYSEKLYNEDGTEDVYAMYGYILDIYNDDINYGIMIKEGNHYFYGNILMLDEGSQYAYKETRDLKSTASINYIHKNNKFKTRLVRNNSNKIIGIIAREVKREV